MNTSEQDFNTSIEEKPRPEEATKKAPEAHRFLYGKGRVKPDPEDNPLAELDYTEFATLGEEAVRLWTEEAPRNSARRSNK
jgi:hypothetical protein